MLWAPSLISGIAPFTANPLLPSHSWISTFLGCWRPCSPTFSTSWLFSTIVKRLTSQQNPCSLHIISLSPLPLFASFLLSPHLSCYATTIKLPSPPGLQAQQKNWTCLLSDINSLWREGRRVGLERSCLDSERSSLAPL